MTAGLVLLAGAAGGACGISSQGASSGGTWAGADAGGASPPAGDDAATDAPPGSNDGATSDASGAGGDSAGGGDGGPPHVASLGYYTGDQGSLDAITAFHADLTMVSADLFDVQTSGALAGSDDLGVIAHDGALGLETFACISNYSSSLGDFDPALGHTAMVTNRDAVVANIVQLAGTGFDGINIDFESLAYSANVADDRAAYTAFVHDLSGKLHAAGKKLVLSVASKTSDVATDTWGYPYDYAALAPDVDYLQLMTYDENGPGWSGPGPVSGADWVKSCVAYAVSVVSPSKLLIGLPAYGYDWDLTASTPASNKYVGTSVSWKDLGPVLAAAGATTHWDAASSTPYVDYTAADGHHHEAWYDDPQSIAAKSKLVTQYGLAGLSMWSLGQEDASFWQAAYAGL